MIISDVILYFVALFIAICLMGAIGNMFMEFFDWVQRSIEKDKDKFNKGDRL